VNLRKELRDISCRVKESSRFLAGMSVSLKNKILEEMACALELNSGKILAANKLDLSSAKKSGLSRAFIDRLQLDQSRILQMSVSLRELIKLKDPVGDVIKAWKVPNGLWIHKVRVPLGVVAIIYESRPNVTADCIGLCFKSGNSVILRGGSQALRSNLAIAKVLFDAARKHGVPEGAMHVVSTADRRAVAELLKLNEYIDVVIPRGGKGLIDTVVRLSRIPVIKHYQGICHVYVDEWADLNMAEKICFNAKVQRPGVCNAMETLLVHKDMAARFLPLMLKRFKDAGVVIHGCPLTVRIAKRIKSSAGSSRWFRKATEKDYRTEYLDLILSVRVVESLAQAITHINTYGSHHSDSIVSEHYESTLTFLNQVDSACVYVNASTRFTDGGEFGMGAEIGISTDKLHARGPMALEELTSYKYMVFGNGQVRTS